MVAQRRVWKLDVQFLAHAKESVEGPELEGSKMSLNSCPYSASAKLASTILTVSVVFFVRLRLSDRFAFVIAM
jgi:hypothetical protein